MTDLKLKCGYCGKIVWPWQRKTDYYAAISSFKHGTFYVPLMSHYTCWYGKLLENSEAYWGKVHSLIPVDGE